MTTAIKRANSVLAVVVDEIHRSIVFNVAGAAPDGGGKSITLRLDDINPANVDYAALHGFKQRIGDMAALSRDPVTGRAATPADKFAAIEAGVLHYHSGSPDWNMRAAGGERTGGELGLLARAIAAIKGRDIVEVRDWLKTKTDGERVKLAISPAIKELIDGYRAERASDVDAEELLAELA
jgi:hypothetical protein